MIEISCHIIKEEIQEALCEVKVGKADGLHLLIPWYAWEKVTQPV